MSKVKNKIHGVNLFTSTDLRKLIDAFYIAIDSLKDIEFDKYVIYRPILATELDLAEYNYRSLKTKNKELYQELLDLWGKLEETDEIKLKDNNLEFDISKNFKQIINDFYLAIEFLSSKELEEYIICRELITTELETFRAKCKNLKIKDEEIYNEIKKLWKEIDKIDRVKFLKDN